MLFEKKNKGGDKMRKRSKIRRRKSQKLFSRTARMRKGNKRKPGLKRGGTRL